MPIHDWTRVRANRFHHFHQSWTPLLAAELNRGILPANYFALTEQITSGPEPDVVTLSAADRPDEPSVGLALDEAPIQVCYTTEAESRAYALRANRISIRHADGAVIAVIEIVSPGNKDSRHAIRAFCRKAARFLLGGVHLLIVDLFPPSRRDPQGLHPLIWNHIREEAYTPPADRPLSLLSYAAGPIIRAFVEPTRVGEPLREMPLFLTPDHYVNCPLEPSYQQAWQMFPEPLRADLEPHAT